MSYVLVQSTRPQRPNPFMQKPPSGIRNRALFSYHPYIRLVHLSAHPSVHIIPSYSVLLSSLSCPLYPLFCPLNNSTYIHHYTTHYTLNSAIFTCANSTENLRHKSNQDRPWNFSTHISADHQNHHKKPSRSLLISLNLSSLWSSHLAPTRYPQVPRVLTQQEKEL